MVMAFSCLPLLVLERSTLVDGVGEWEMDGEEKEEEDDEEDEDEESRGEEKEEEEDGGDVEGLKVTLFLGGRWGDWPVVAGRWLIFRLLCSSGGAGSGRSCLYGASGLAGSSVARRRWRLSSLAPRRQLRAVEHSWENEFISTLSSINFT